MAEDLLDQTFSPPGINNFSWSNNNHSLANDEDGTYIVFSFLNLMQKRTIGILSFRDETKDFDHYSFDEFGEIIGFPVVKSDTRGKVHLFFVAKDGRQKTQIFHAKKVAGLVWETESIFTYPKSHIYVQPSTTLSKSPSSTAPVLAKTSASSMPASKGGKRQGKPLPFSQPERGEVPATVRSETQADEKRETSRPTTDKQTIVATEKEKFLRSWESVLAVGADGDSIHFVAGRKGDEVRGLDNNIIYFNYDFYEDRWTTKEGEKVPDSTPSVESLDLAVPPNTPNHTPNRVAIFWQTPPVFSQRKGVRIKSNLGIYYTLRNDLSCQHHTATLKLPGQWCEPRQLQPETDRKKMIDGPPQIVYGEKYYLHFLGQINQSSVYTRLDPIDVGKYFTALTTKWFSWPTQIATQFFDPPIHATSVLPISRFWVDPKGQVHTVKLIRTSVKNVYTVLDLHIQSDRKELLGNMTARAPIKDFQTLYDDNKLHIVTLSDADGSVSFVHATVNISETSM